MKSLTSKLPPHLGIYASKLIPGEGFLSIDSYDVMNGILDNIRFNFLNNQEVIEALKTCGKRSSLEGKGEASSKI
jgi:hypothetical protein